MRKLIALSAVLCLLALCLPTAYAAPYQIGGMTVDDSMILSPNDAGMYSVAYGDKAGETVDNGKWYTIVAVAGIYTSTADLKYTADDIQHIDQAAAANGRVVFADFEPRSAVNSTVLISGGTLSGPVIAGYIAEGGAPVKTYTVTFDLAGGTHSGGGALKQTIAAGKAAAAPLTTRSGYTFTGWDKSFSAVNADMLVTALWTYNETPGSRVNRVAGGNRYDTSARTALDAYPDGTAAVIIARGDNEGQFADGLAASYLSALKKAPILLTSPGSLPQETENAVKKLKPETAYVLGGELAVSPAVAGKLKSLGLKLERIQGANRYDTAAAIAAKGGQADTALVVSGFAPADSLVAGAPASSNKYPILLVSKNSVPAETKTAIAGLGIRKIIVIGGENVVGKAVYTELEAKERCSGHSRIETSLAVAQKFFDAPHSFSIVGYLNLADAVGAAAYANPIIYVKGDLSDVHGYLKGAAASAAGTRFAIFGGTLAVNSAVETALQKLPN
jgi:putative cell wall-binding protein